MGNRIETSVKAIQVRIYGEHPDNYICCLNIHCDGEKGFIDSLIGRGFYENVKEIFALMSAQYGVIELSGSVMPAHARAIQRYLEKDFEITYEGTRTAKRAMIWITVRKKD